jgi:hypothetical protein
MNTVEVGFTTSDKEFNAFLKGVAAGRRDALEDLVRCKDCKWFRNRFLSALLLSVGD